MGRVQDGARAPHHDQDDSEPPAKGTDLASDHRGVPLGLVMTPEANLQDAGTPGVVASAISR